MIAVADACAAVSVSVTVRVLASVSVPVRGHVIGKKGGRTAKATEKEKLTVFAVQQHQHAKLWSWSLHAL